MLEFPCKIIKLALMILSLYRTLLWPAAPVLRHVLARRLARGKEDAARLGERMGRPSLPRPQGAVVWLHAASVGESLSLLSLIEALREQRPDLALVLTTGTVTSARLMAARLPAGVIHQYMPVDHPRWVASFLDHWRPDAVLWSESEFWPAILDEVRRRGIPAALVNARMSVRSYTRWCRVRGFAKKVLSVFTVCLAQTAREAGQLRDLGARSVDVVGNLKYAARPLPDQAEARVALEEATRGRPLLLWASTHPGEDEIAAATHVALACAVPGLLTVIVPRHPARGDAIAADIALRGLRVAQRSQGALPVAATDVYVADTLGELGVFYRLCPTVVMGGTFADIGGHNPIEPAQLGAVVVCGPELYNFSAIRDDFAAAKAMIEVKDPWSMVPILRDRLQNPAQYDAIQQAALALTGQQAHVLDRIIAALADVLPRKGGEA